MDRNRVLSFESQGNIQFYEAVERLIIKPSHVQNLPICCLKESHGIPRAGDHARARITNSKKLKVLTYYTTLVEHMQRMLSIKSVKEVSPKSQIKLWKHGFITLKF